MMDHARDLDSGLANNEIRLQKGILFWASTVCGWKSQEEMRWDHSSGAKRIQNETLGNMVYPLNARI